MKIVSNVDGFTIRKLGKELPQILLNKGDSVHFNEADAKVYAPYVKDGAVAALVSITDQKPAPKETIKDIKKPLSAEAKTKLAKEAEEKAAKEKADAEKAAKAAEAKAAKDKADADKKAKEDADKAAKEAEEKAKSEAAADKSK